MARGTPTKSTGFFENRFILILTVACIAIVIRGIFLALADGTFLWDGVWSDAAMYNQWAMRIVADGNWVGSDPFFMSPLYPYFLAVTYSLFGQSLLAVRLLQIIAGTATAVLLFFIGEKLFSPKAGFVAGLLAALYGPFLLSNTLLLVETLKVFFLVLTLWLLLVAGERKRFWYWLAAGVSLGSAVLCRPADLLVGLFVAGWFFLAMGTDFREKARRSALFFAGLLLVIVPVTIRNYAVSGEFVPITTNGGLNFYIGNNPSAVGVYYNVDRLDIVNDPDGRVYLESQLGRSLGHTEVSSIWFSRAIDFILHEPLDFIALLGKKLLLLFHYREISQLGYNYLFVAEHAVPLLSWLPTFLFIGPIGILGVVWSFRKRRDLALLYGFLLAEIVAIILFFVTDRFRLSIVPFLMLFAGQAITQLIEIVKKKNFRELRVAGLVIICALAGMTDSFFWRGLLPGTPGEGEDSVIEKIGLNYDIPTEFSLEWQQVGLLDFNMGRYREALRSFAESYKYRDSFSLRNNTGNAYLALGRFDDAMEQYEAGQKINPNQAVSAFSMGTAYASRKDWTSALDAFDQSIAINPRFAPAHLNRALVLYYLQQFDEALAGLKRYAELEPDKSKLTTVYGDIENLERLIATRNARNAP